MIKDKGFYCPNCGNKMLLKKENMNVEYLRDDYDKWTCPDCPLLVLDWRSQ